LTAVSLRALFPFEAERRVELLTLAPQKVENADPHALGATQNLVVDAGEIEITLNWCQLHLKGRRRYLRPIFRTDTPQSRTNTGIMHLMMTYPDPIGWPDC
jgi:hypothetical protein